MPSYPDAHLDTVHSRNHLVAAWRQEEAASSSLASSADGSQVVELLPDNPAGEVGASSPEAVASASSWEDMDTEHRKEAASELQQASDRLKAQAYLA